ncbi:MAG TPA: C-type lectin domain-containing protein, partial [Phycisphaerales bacterium]|nr:C-type lectin domain-containing protein [Phycisphaerales bacterium]
VEGATWSAIRDAGRAMGGDLATIENATENEWVRANLAAPVGNKLWIGLNDAATEGTFAWSDGSTSSYRNWAPGEPSNNATNDYTQLLNDGGLWAHRTASYTTMGVIEVKGAVRVPQEAATVVAGVALAQQSSREVLIAPGTFNATTTMDINVPVTIRGSGRGVTTLNGHVNGETFDTNADFTLESMSLVVRTDFEFVEVSTDTTTIRDCNVTSILGQDGLECFEVWGASLVLERCDVHNAQSFVYTPDPTASVRVTNCLLRDMVQLFESTPSSHLTATNCVISNISGAAAIPGTTETFLRNTIVVNTPGTWPALTTASHCVLPAALPGSNNILSTNPGFVNAAAGDFTLLPTSPAIDAGSIAHFLAAGATDLVDFAGQARVKDAPGLGILPLMNPIDIGPLEFQGGVGCDDIDFNNDGLFPDTEDINAFIRVFGGGSCE